ncbi:MAG: aminotransferase class V-fold PLP-dependent enzyme [Planctomycetaceae bacterium]
MLIEKPDLGRFDWQEFTSAWDLAPGLVYLNHGSFGPSPLPVRQARQHWSDVLERNPVEFFFRRQDALLEEAAIALGRFVGSRPDNLVFVPNATMAMNIVAQNTSLAAGDEVLLNGHEYGAVIRIWGSYCRRVGAKTVLARLPDAADATSSDYVDAIFSRVTPRTRLIVVSHVTSPTALILPVAEICQRARKLGIPVCVDGPHAVAMLPLELDKLGCDYYCASLHKWLSAPFGSGFLYVAPRRKSGLQPSIVSWGRSLSGRDFRWVDEFHWSGTLDPAANLAVPEAIRFLEQVGVERFRSQCHTLAQYAGWQLQQRFGAIPLASKENFGTMLTLALPQVARIEGRPGVPHPLQMRLAKEFQIEVPFVEWQDRMHIRVSCHLYNTPEHIDHLAESLAKLIDA